MKRAIMVLVIALVGATTSAYGAAAEKVPFREPTQYLFIAQLNSWCTGTTYLDGQKEQIIYICKPIETDRLFDPSANVNTSKGK